MSVSKQPSKTIPQNPFPEWSPFPHAGRDRQWHRKIHKIHTLPVHLAFQGQNTRQMQGKGSVIGNLQQELQRQSTDRAQYKNTSQELLVILEHPSFWKAGLSLHSIEENIKHSALGSAVSEANTDVNTVIHLCTSPDSSYFGFLICSSNQPSVNLPPLFVRKNAHVTSLDPTGHIELFQEFTLEFLLDCFSRWVEQSQFILPFSISKCKQCTAQICPETAISNYLGKTLKINIYINSSSFPYFKYK